jgi:hypothetical protein
MQSNSARILVGIAAVAAAVILLLVLKNGGDDKSSHSSTSATNTGTTSTGAGSEDPVPAQPAVTTIVVRNGEPVGGVAEISVDEGERVRFKVKSDISEEIHVHGYDLMKDVEAGGSVTFDFPATIEGIFEAELEGKGEQILELTVNP